MKCGRSQSRYFCTVLDKAKSMFVTGVLDTVVNIILSATISPDISKMDSMTGSVRLNPWESQSSLFQSKTDEYAGAGAL